MHETNVTVFPGTLPQAIIYSSRWFVTVSRS